MHRLRTSPSGRILLTLASLSAAATAQEWTLRSIPGNPPLNRYQGAAAYDAARGASVYFGGFVRSVLTAETLVWDGTSLTVFPGAAAGPAARVESALAFDPRRNVVVMFGGRTGTQREDDSIWEWDGLTWTRRSFASFPSARRYHGMAYDAATGRVLVVGGSNTNPNSPRETWEYDGSAWTRRAALVPVPYLSGPQRITTNPATGRTTILDGSGLWEWDGQPAQGAWRRIGPHPVTSSFGDTALTAAPKDRLIFVQATASNEAITMEWDGSAWSERPVNIRPPSPIVLAAACFDTARGMTVMLAGNVAGTLSVWELDNENRLASAIAVPGRDGCGTPPLTLSAAAASRPLLGAAMTLATVASGNGMTAVNFGFSDRSWGNLPLPFDLTRFGLTNCRAYVSLDASFANSSTGRLTFGIPNRRELLGLELYCQSLAVAPGSNPAGVVVSNELVLTLGTY